jgi:hypothetical protein
MWLFTRFYGSLKFLLKQMYTEVRGAVKTAATRPFKQTASAHASRASVKHAIST